MDKHKQNRYASALNISIVGGKTFAGKKRKVTADEVKENINASYARQRRG